MVKLDPDTQSHSFKLGWSEYKAGIRDGLDRMKSAIDAGVDDAESLGKLGEVLMREGPDRDLE